MAQKNGFLHWLKQESARVIPAIIYFAIVFNLIYFTSGLMLEPGQSRYFSVWMVTFGALIIGKVLIIVNALPFVNAFPNQALLYNILWKFFIYMLAVFLFWMLDAFIHMYDKFDNVTAVIQFLKLDILSAEFWSSILWLAMTFLVFIVFSEYTRVLGLPTILRLLLKRR